ncbi:sigma-70 family RNA polymerase sigma factor [Dysgonomonas sp. 216]|uniref:RNA polymerase sigma factor n=1 Tax=Dysgonomonas sp. 216 TaxID=2302934 RepID=UPI0013D4B9FA|nr:sigma-70 family RNA polymerase sigma factor [Dysgonomonas sp. 216]NDW17721.1 sigma-70 family RNA polymerase sigma factor [Dysgonomonas sp. 216]
MKKNDFVNKNPNAADVAEIYNTYRLPLKGFIAKHIPSKEDCEDILHNVFYQLSRIDLEENPIEQMSAWLYSVARNQIIDKSRKHKEEELPYFHDSDDDEVVVRDITQMLLEIDSPETDFMKTLVWEELEQSLSELPPEQREVFELTELEGFSFKEISEATGIGVNTLISRKRYAVLHLRKRLLDLYEDLLSE